MDEDELPETAECSVLECTTEGQLYLVHAEDPANSRLGYLCPKHRAMVG